MNVDIYRGIGEEMDNINYVVDKIVAGEVFFFAGSGISYASNLPSADAILEHTANVFLPSSINNKAKQNICERIQPEIFYESIINMTQTFDCLDIWRSLYKLEQATHGLICSPNFAHLFIAENSKKNNVPIITTNFDAMFEQACELLDIRYDILLPTDSPPNADPTVLTICKVHGSIQNIRGEYSPNTLWTTMTQITKVNTRWIEYLNDLMTKKHLCFVGYSGKDIDIFPYVTAIHKKVGVKNILWINRFDGDHSDKASKTCSAVRACLWPIELFETIAINILNGQRAQNIFKTNNEPATLEKLLLSLEESLSAKKLLTDQEKELLYCGLLAKLGHYREAHLYATELESIILTKINRHHSKHLLLLTCARLSHEISRYVSCKKYARQLLAMLKSKGGYEINAAIQAICLISESNRMSIPYNTYFNQPKKICDYYHISFVVTHFILSSFTIKAMMLYQNLIISELNVETQHELIEHRIRFWALIQSIFRSPQLSWNSHVKAFLSRVWDRIRDRSYIAGYSAGIANAGRFKYQLISFAEAQNESANIYNLTTYATGTELLCRNEADRLLRERKFRGSRRKFVEYTNMANKSGNILNEIKGIIGYAYANHLEGKKPLLTKKLRKQFAILIAQVEGRRWKDHFAFISSLIVDDTKNI